MYYRSAAGTVEELNALAGLAHSHDAALGRLGYRALVGPGRADAGDAALTCLAFRKGCPRAEEATTYLRMTSLSRSERDTTERVAALMEREGIPAGPYRDLVDALAPQPLEAFTGLQELVGFRAVGRRTDMTTYFRFPVYPVARPSHGPPGARRSSRSPQWRPATTEGCPGGCPGPPFRRTSPWP
ncbi:hypothetical protein [Streptomyces sp. NPDC021356]|uniref:hypothetical protein n=1 Tax=Streptomyces sp. NPDC021356 TaxID=3154900 RepID=UPI0033ED795E